MLEHTPSDCFTILMSKSDGRQYLVSNTAMAFRLAVPENPGMSKDPRKNRIAELRRARGWSMDQLAERANTTGSQINKLEKGRVSLTTDWMYRIADALEVHPMDLLDNGGLEPDEKAILDLYRGLDDRERAQFRAVANALAQPREDDGPTSKFG